MSEFDYMGYNQRKRAATSQFGAKAASSAYANFLAQQRGARKKFDIQQAYEKDAPRLISRFSQRGLAGPGVQSGIYSRGLGEFAQKNVRDLGDWQSEMDQEQQRFDLENRQLRADYDSQIAQLEAEKQAQIAQAAATLSAFKPFLGS